MNLTLAHSARLWFIGPCRRAGGEETPKDRERARALRDNPGLTAIPINFYRGYINISALCIIPGINRVARYQAK